jgi:hypothetical protein
MARFAQHVGWRLRALVVVALVAAIAVPVVVAANTAKVKSTTFQMFPNQSFVPCLKNGNQSPTAQVTVKRGRLADKLILNLAGFKPGLDFDLFTVERSNQLANGNPDPNFHGFGLAWYQTDVHIASDGTSKTSIKTILLDQIFGFDPDVALAPTNTFHVGFWFNNPADAMPCGFTGSTPFNGEHNAGPVAFITRPDAITGLGPLCTDPNSSPPPPCHP